MKKYLMTVMAAAALGGMFTGCSKDADLSGGQNSAEFNIVQNYENAFITRFGQPAANQTWGFGSAAALTRSENANANEWADPNKAYGGLKVPPPLTDEQKAVVIKYFQTTKDLGYEDPHWTNYFIQQVYKGHTSPREGYSPEAYLAANGSTYLYASDYMDHLAAIDGNFVDHINNFNHGDCSENGTVLDNGGNANDGPFHSDKIMYMKESTTKSFGYYNSNGSVRRTEYTGLVSYKTIMKALGSEADCLEDGWNRSFMGFDFEQMVGPEIYAKGVNRQDENGNWQWYADEYAMFEFEGKNYNFLTSQTNMYCADLKEESYKQKNGSTSTTGGKANFNDRPSDNIIRDLLSKGYLPYSDTLKDWVKVGGCADGYFSDWIVTLTEAKGGTTPPPSDPNIVCRIIVEDLTVGESSDFDFNDVVFDVRKDGILIIRAIGGELPIYIGSEGANEVHAVCSVTLDDTKKGANSHMMMRNTGWSSSGSKTNVAIVYNADLGHINLNRTFSSKEEAKEIGIWVHKNGTNIRLQAPVGKVASMICVGQDYKWCAERQDIDDKYHKDGVKLFHQYVIGDPNYGDDWEHNNAWYQKLDQ